MREQRMGEISKKVGKNRESTEREHRESIQKR